MALLKQMLAGVRGTGCRMESQQFSLLEYMDTGTTRS